MTIIWMAVVALLVMSALGWYSARRGMAETIVLRLIVVGGMFAYCLLMIFLAESSTYVYFIFAVGIGILLQREWKVWSRLRKKE